MPSAVWKASGHLDGFTDSIVDCSLSGTQFRVDKAGPVVAATTGSGETTITILAPHKKTAKLWEEQIQTDFAADARVVREGCLLHLSVAELVDPSTATDGSKVPGRIELRTQNSDLETIKIEYNGYVCPITNSPFLGTPRDINLMYQVVAIDDSAPIGDSDEQYTVSDEFDSMIRTIREGNPLQKAEMRNSLKRELLPRSMYLRPETAQGTYVQTPNAKRSLEESGPRPTTFGLAQIGESYRNEIAVEHFSFRSSEFDQMEMQYFCPAQDEKQCFNFWVRDRLAWWHDLARVPEDFITLNVDKEDLAHYASGKSCVDIEYRYPWGFDEIEGIASRSNYDMNLHSKYHELEKTNVDDGGLKESFVIEPAAGLSRAVLAFLCDAYTEDVRTDAKGEYIQTVLQLHPKLSPYKAAVLPLVRNNAEFVRKVRALVPDHSISYCFRTV
ncbi:hypothetical protein SARC_03762 [Sphaeroforma arctica JP610]|uniref:Aminoacyl-transfer RNA synthetases class-II family profile domain-containing protein n=1 Tax=Sphaeroforma arctica JP610 TaxID=667725 RepID=A0A0L0G599_9EUKA|nr:hypothetical protein SARC_03762 [Sphaeroforma arctica JP610]KNC84001.1 hypothetical protein SARC_03762 [Sphaeroforma arctica JP610]|eukprot:XP_014157903.1 hypothetical protein SARC_03762 [Sphaeroforma arctica JP610]